VKTRGRVTLYSWRCNDLTKRFDYVATALATLPDDTVIDGELVAFDEEGRPNFNLLQNFRSSTSHITYYAFDILIHQGKSVMDLPLVKRRAILATAVQPSNHVGLSHVSDKTAAQMLHFVRSHGLEGIIAKRADSVYQPGKLAGTGRRLGPICRRSSSSAATSRAILESIRSWSASTKVRISIMQRGCGLASFLLLGVEVFEAIKHLKDAKCPFVNLPKKDAGRWEQGFTADKMKEAVWLEPTAVAQIEFLEWTGANHLRHTKFVSLRDDKDPRKVVREG
jgi:ATP-dependent DNA ligase